LETKVEPFIAVLKCRRGLPSHPAAEDAANRVFT